MNIFLIAILYIWLAIWQLWYLLCKLRRLLACIFSKVYQIINFTLELFREIYIVSHIIAISNYQEYQREYFILEEEDYESDTSRYTFEIHVDYVTDSFIEKCNIQISIIQKCGICHDETVKGIKPICCFQKQEICISCLCKLINIKKISCIECPYCRDIKFLEINKINIY